MKTKLINGRFLYGKRLLKIVMKTFIFLLCTTIFALSPSNVVSQNSKIKVNNDSVLTVDQVFDLIMQQTDYKFFYEEGIFNDFPKVHVKKGTIKTNTLLSRSLSKADLDITLTNNNAILIKEKVKPLVTPQGIAVDGKVLDAQNQPLFGANILEKGTTNGTQTDFNGEFSIEVANENAVLVVSYLGYATKEIAVGNQTNITITLQEDISGLDEVVVVGFGTQKKENLTGSVASVDLEEVISDRPITSAAVALQGTIPGLQITANSGEPGNEGLGLELRGFTSINGAQPLFLVDNVPVSLGDINPQDIKTITVLKDASAAAIYGARAAFGVILITTKKPKGKTTFEYSLTTSFSSPTEIPKAASPLEFVTALNDWGRNPYWALGEDIPTWLGYLQEYQTNPSAYPLGYAEEGGIRYRLKENNHVKDFYSDSGLTTIHNLSFGGSTENSSYRVSLGYSNEDGIMISDNDKFERYNLNAFLSSKLTKNLTGEVNVYYRNSTKTEPKASYGGIIGNYSFLPTGFHENPDGTFLPYDTPSNIVELEVPNSIYNKNLRVFGKLIYEPIHDLKITGEYTFESKNGERVNVNVDPVYMRGARLSTAGGVPENTSYYNAHSNSTYKATNIYAKYDKVIAEDHNFSLLTGFNYEEEGGKSLWASKNNLINPDLPSISGATGTLTSDDGFWEWAVMGVYGRFNYNYKSKYFIELNGRYDGSSRFRTEDNFGLFPSISVGWNIAKESFMESLDEINTLKIRASLGEIGNQVVLFGNGAQNYYPAVVSLPAGNSSWINTASQERYITLGTPGVISDGFTWETVRTLNFGLDLNMLNNRLAATFDIFKRETLDMITSGEELPSVFGTAPPTANAANLETKGWEFDMSWKDRIGDDFTYSIGFNLFDSQTEITKFGNEENLLNQFYVGQQLGEIWGFVTDGYYTEADFEPGSLSSGLTGGTLIAGVPSYQGVNENPGDIKYMDLNGDGVIFTGNNTLEDPGDRKVIGNSRRRYQYGINLALGYKNFDLSVFGNGVGKRDIFLGNDLYWPFTGQFANIFKHHLDYWTPENQNAFYPRNYSFDNSNYGNSRRTQTKYLQNGAYFTIKNITLGYNFPDTMLDKLSLNKLRIYFSGENLFLFDHLPEGLHPEFGDRGAGAAYPYQRKFALGINVGF